MTDTWTPRRRSIWQAMGRGVRRRCPACGVGHAFGGYLKARDCGACETPLGQIRADDFPPYITIFLVGHILVPLMVWAERDFAWPLWLHLAVWLPATLALSLLILPFAKGAVLGLMWALRL
ncbi:MAG: DUF983 domain-containing protein, partial [Azospirillaceae bacterium]